MNIKPIRTEADHAAALARIDALMDAPDPSPERDELEVLVTLVSAYEDVHHVIAPPDPIEALRFRIEQQGLSEQDLTPYLGSAARVTEILDRRRPLTLPMIRKLHRGLHIPLESLVQDYDLRHPQARIPE